MTGSGGEVVGPSRGVAEVVPVFKIACALPPNTLLALTSLSLAHNHAYTVCAYVSPSTCCMLMLIISQGRLMAQLSARQARQRQVLRGPPTHSNTMHGDKILDKGAAELPHQLRRHEEKV